MRRSTTILIEILGTIVAGLAILFAVVAWRLSEGPIELSLLTPMIEAALSQPDGGFTLKLDRTVLAWGGWSRSLDLQAIGVHINDPTGQPVLTLPEMSLRLSGRALVEGVVAPTAFEITGAQLHLRRNADGQFDLEIADRSSAVTNPNVLPLVLKDMLGRPTRNRPISFLNRITITNADLVVEDSHWDTSWKATLPRLVLDRDEGGIHAVAELDIHVGESTTHFEASGLYSGASQRLSFTLHFRDLLPATFARAAPVLAPLEALSLPFAGQIDAEVALDGTLNGLHFDVSAGPGRLVLPELYPEDLEITGLAAKGSVSDGGASLVLEEGDVELFGATVTLHGATHAAADGSRTVKLDLVAHGVKIDDLPDLWPEGVAENPRRWITANLSSGAVDELYASIEAHGTGIEPKDLEIDRVGGTMHVSGTSVLYIGKMPKVRGVSGDVRFDDKSFTITLTKGGLNGLELDGGTVLITGLDGNDHRIAIDLPLHGPLRAVLDVIDSEPLRYAHAIGLDPKTVEGGAKIRLSFKFPLLHDLRLAQLDAAAEGEFSGVHARDILLGHDLSRGELRAHITKEGMQAAGTAEIGPMPVTLSWNERFGKSTERRIKLSGELDEAAQRAFGFDGDALIRGPVHVALEMKSAEHAPSEVDLALDLTKAKLTLPRVDWQKAAGVGGKAHLVLTLSGERLASIPSFTVTAGDLSAEGAVTFDGAASAFRTLRLDRLAFGRDRLAGSVTHRPDGVYAVALEGEALDASAFLKEDEGAAAKESGPRLAVSLRAKTLWLSRGKVPPLRDASATLEHNGQRVQSLRFEAKTAGGAGVHLEIVPEAGKRKIAASAENAGELFKAVDFADNVVGGKLKLDGSYDDSKPDPPLAGILRMSDFKIREAPLPVKLLTVISPTGFGNALSGSGIDFTTLVAPFTRTDTRIEVSKGYIVGSELGITFEGWVDPHAEQLQIDGTVAPIYTLNSLLGNIPGLGEILVGPKGSGMFAATYRAKGKLDDPDVAVNPVSVLAPGILRELVKGLFGNGTDLEPGPRDTATQGGG